MLKYLASVFFPFLALTFAAGAPPLTESSATETGAADLPSDSSDGAASDYGLGEVETAETTETGEVSTTEGEHTETKIQQPEDKETGDFKGIVSRRLASFAKKNPALGQVLNTPEAKEFRDFVEATARRDLAYREYGTVADFRMLREHFPGGMQDVQQLLEDVGSVEKLDQDFYNRDRDGSYPGHRSIIENMFSDDREAAVSLFKELPKQWARLDPDSYREVMGQIVGATLARAEVPEVLSELIEAARDAKQPGLEKSLSKLLNWATGFMREKPQPTEEERRIQRDREQLNRERGDRVREDSVRFHQNFVRESRKLQLGIIGNHPAMQQLAKVQAITPEKRQKIQEEVRSRIEKHLSSSASFMRKLRAAHSAGNLQETINLQKAQWAYPWILNKFVRQVLAEETPQMVRQNRETVGKRRQQTVQTTRPGGEQKQEGKPYQIGKTWYYGDGRKVPMSEILRNGPPQV